MNIIFYILAAFGSLTLISAVILGLLFWQANEVLKDDGVE